VVGQAVPPARLRLTSPLLPGCHQASRHRMVLNVADNPISLPSVAYPVKIVRLILPEGLCGSSQQLVRLSRGPGLQPAQDGGNRHPGQDQQMHVIGHHHPRIQLITTPAFSDLNRLHRQRRNAWIAQPLWAEARAVKNTIRRHESVGWCGRCARYSDRREQTEEAPGEKDVDIIGLEMGELEMGQSTTIFEQEGWAGGAACPTKSSAPNCPRFSGTCRNSRRD